MKPPERLLPKAETAPADSVVMLTLPVLRTRSASIEACTSAKKLAVACGTCTSAKAPPLPRADDDDWPSPIGGLTWRSDTPPGPSSRFTAPGVVLLRSSRNWWFSAVPPLAARLMPSLPSWWRPCALPTLMDGTITPSGRCSWKLPPDALTTV